MTRKAQGLTTSPAPKPTVDDADSTIPGIPK